MYFSSFWVSEFGHPYQYNGMKIPLDTSLQISKYLKIFHEQYLAKPKTSGKGLFIVANLNNTEIWKSPNLKKNSHILVKERQYYQDSTINYITANVYSLTDHFQYFLLWKQLKKTHFKKGNLLN